ncbi:MAG TPA: ATP-binding protein [Geobacterales bacterium]|nr:ATP-binding protein [Geobacterales bacterium]
MELQELNHWWIEGSVKESLVPEFKRDLFNIILQDIARRQICIITGLRRTGKSTLMFQLIDQLIRRGINPRKILYISFDEPNFQQKRIEEILREYSKITRMDYKSDEIYLFFDEIQKAKEWTSSVKLIYDNLKNVRKIVISGSASLNLIAEAKKDLAGRALYYELKPMSFAEFLRFKGIRVRNEDVDLYREILQREFELFKLRPFPEIAREEDMTFIKKYIYSAVIEPIILKDIPKEFKEVDVLLLERLVHIFLTEPGRYLKVDELAKELSRAKITIYKALFYLEFSYIVRKLLNFRPSIRSASRKLSKIYAYHPGLCIPFNISEDRYAENLVCSELNASYYWRERGKEIDFLVNNAPVEVKYTSKIGKEDLRWIRYFEKKYAKSLGIKHAFIITKDLEYNVNNIALIPLWKFSFQGLPQIDLYLKDKAI